MEETLPTSIEPARTEEIQAIIERMPASFGVWITSFVLILVITLFSLAWIIEYPDVVTGEIKINGNSSPITLVASSSGRLSINSFKPQDEVMEGDYIAIIQNSALLKDIKIVKEVIDSFSVNNLENEVGIFPKNISVGELNGPYFAFIEAYEKFIEHHEEDLFSKQSDVLSQMLLEQGNILDVTKQKLAISKENIRLVGKFHNRDSILLKRRVLTEAEFDKSDMNFLSVKEAHHTMINNVTAIREQMHETSNKKQQIEIQRIQARANTRLSLISAYTDLAANFKMWEQKYSFKSPLRGKIQFSKFWKDNQFVQSGESVFTVVPINEKIVGQMTMPAMGAGKVKIGQEVIIKLENYPYQEYGSVKGVISSISLTTNSLKTQAGEVQTYLVNVELPDKLKTNYGSILDFKFEIKGTGEIITKDRKLLERLFDNLKYTANK